MKKLTQNRQNLTFFTIFLMIVTLLFTHGMAQAADDFTEMEQKVREMADDTAKVHLLIKLGEHYCSVENDKALMYLQEAFTIATSLNYKPGIARSLLWQGRVYYYKDEYPLSDKYLDKAKIILEEIKDKDDLPFYYFAKGVNFNIRGDYIHALEMYKKSISISEETGNEKWLSTSYLSIGIVLLNRQEPRKALKYFREALEMKKQIDDRYGMATIYSSIGRAYDQLGKLDSAYYYTDKGLKIREQLTPERLVASSLYALSGILIKKGQYAEAEKQIKKALDIFTKVKDDTGIIISNLRLAVAENRERKPEAIPRAENALKMAKTIDNPNLVSYAYKKLSEMYAFNNDYKNSYDCLLKHKNLQDSLFTAEKERTLAEMETKFQSEKKDKDIALLKEKTIVERNRNIMLIILLVVFLIVIFLLIVMFRYKSTAFNRQQKLLEQEKVIHEQENQIAEKEKQLLREQLESKNRELASKALEMIRVNETISEIIEKLEEFNSAADADPKMVKNIESIIHDLEIHTKQNIWNEFDKIFKNIHSGFYARLLEICSDLTSTEIKTAALLKLNLTTKEIAAITFKSEGSIRTTRHRLRKKLGLTGDDNLVPFLMQI